jgi:hypothetical protein
MKTKSLFIKLVVILTLGALISACSEDKKLPILREFVSKTDKSGSNIDAQIYPNPLPSKVHNAVAKELVEATSTHITLNGSALDLFAEEIDAAELDSFEVYANALTCNPACADWMTGMRIIYSQDGASLKLYYQPILLCATNAARPGPKGNIQDFDLCNSGSFYEYTSGRFKKLITQAQLDDMTNRIDNYKIAKSPDLPYGVQIKNPAGIWENFDATNDDNPAGSVKSVVYPLGELISLNTGRMVKLWNTVELTSVKKDGVTTLYHKHNILLSTENVTSAGTILNVPKDAKFADLSHLCPPSCNGNRFTIYVE